MTNKLNIVWSPTGYDLFRLCELRYYYRYNLNKTAVEKGEALDRGTLIHTGCEFYYKSLQNGFKYEQAVDVAIVKMKQKWAEESTAEDADLQLYIDTMEQYFEYWRTEDQRFQIDHVESPFLFLLHEDDEKRIYIDGKIDLTITDNRYVNMPVDHKSMKRDNEVFRMSNQFKAYSYATKSNFVLVNKIGMQKTLKPHEKFRRVMLSYDPLILDDWKQNVIRVTNHFILCSAENSWPMNETSCDKFNRRCEYYEICDSSGEEAKTYKLNANFKSGDPKGGVLAILDSERTSNQNTTEVKDESSNSVASAEQKTS